MSGAAGRPIRYHYWLVAADGGVFTYGDAPFFGSASGTAVVKPFVGLAAAY